MLVDQGCIVTLFAMALHSWGKFTDVSVPHLPFEKTRNGLADKLDFQLHPARPAFYGLGNS